MGSVVRKRSVRFYNFRKMMYNKFVKFKAGLVEMADTLGLDPSGEIRGGSSPPTSI